MFGGYDAVKVIVKLIRIWYCMSYGKPYNVELFVALQVKQHLVFESLALFAIVD